MSDQDFSEVFSDSKREREIDDAAVYRAASRKAEDRIATLLAVIEQCERLITKNHKWHQEYDDYDGYANSELCEEHLNALAVINKVKEPHSPSKTS